MFYPATHYKMLCGSLYRVALQLVTGLLDERGADRGRSGCGATGGSAVCYRFLLLAQ
jgi:hypothetical protein